MGLSPSEDRPGGRGESTYYLVGMEVGGTKKLTGKEMLKNYIFPSQSRLKLELHPNEDEDEDDILIARPAWKPRGLPERRLRRIYYEVKYVDRIMEGNYTSSMDSNYY